MTDFSTLTSLQSRLRSPGVKLFVVSGLALVMLIPALMVLGLVEDRASRASQVVQEISSHVGGQQTFLGPTLAIPYTMPVSGTDVPIRGVYVVFPVNATATLKVATEERRRSLFKVPVFQVDSKMDANFDLTGVPAALRPGAQLDWNRAEIVVGVSDPRGALADATLTFAGKTATLAPADVNQENFTIAGDQSGSLKLVLFGTKVDLAKPGAQFSVSSQLRFSGAQRIAVLAYGMTTHVTAQGDWPSPGFDGGYLPVTRSVSAQGFTADWSVPFMARGVRAEGQSETITGLDGTALGVSLVEVADPYQSVNRSLKYAPLFLGLVFLSYFVFEITTGRRVHPAQYVLIGVAQMIFYLLLLSFAERIGFDFAFLTASAATVLLLSFNAAWIFAGKRYGASAFGIFACLYLLIYLLLRLEDNALLVGAITSFIAVATAMYLTRRVDWYSSLSGTHARSQTAQRAPGDIA